MPILLPTNIFDFETIESNLAEDNLCTHPAGHCYGSDGGSGIPDNLKVPKGQGGTIEVWELDALKANILSKANYSKCQYDGSYIYAGETEDGPKIEKA